MGADEAIHRKPLVNDAKRSPEGVGLVVCGVDMPFKQLLSSSLTIVELAAVLSNKLLTSGTEGISLTKP